MSGPLIIKSQDWLDRQLHRSENLAAVQADRAGRSQRFDAYAKWGQRAEQFAELRRELIIHPWAALEIAQRWQDLTRGGFLRPRREVFLDWEPPPPPGIDGEQTPWDETKTDQLRGLVEDRWSSLGMLDIQRTELTERQADRLIWKLLDTQIQYRHPPRKRTVLKALRTPTRCGVTLGFTATDDHDQAQSYQLTFIAQGAVLEAVDAEPEWMAQEPRWGNLVDDANTMHAAEKPAAIEAFLPADLRNSHDEVLAKIARRTHADRHGRPRRRPVDQLGVRRARPTGGHPR